MLKKRLILPLALVALILAACGGDDDDAAPAATTAAPAAASGIDAQAEEFKFTPSSWNVASGATVTVNLTNAGALEHNLVVVVAGKTVTDPSQLSDGDILIQVDAQAGQTGTGTFTAPPAGSYQVICSIPGHLPAGMEADLTVS